MHIITIKYQGKVYQRRITRKQGFYVMESKGIEYWFGRAIDRPAETAWCIINQKSLEPEFMELVCAELEKLFIENNSRT